MRESLKNKVAVVTGATGLLGRAFSESLVKAGTRVIVADLHQKDCEQLASSLAPYGEVDPRAVDLASPESILLWGKSILSAYEKIDILVNNAASKPNGFFDKFEEFSLEAWNDTMAVNVTAVFLLAQLFGPRMAKAGAGSIINVGSIYGLQGPDPRLYEGSWHEKFNQAISSPLVYSASKGAISAMTKYFATYWGVSGVRANTLVPGGVSAGQNTEFEKKYSAKVPLGRMATPQDLIGALLFLASDDSKYVTGHDLIVDGGFTAW